MPPTNPSNPRPLRITPKNLRDAADILDAQPRLACHDYWEFPDNEDDPVICCTMGAIADAKKIDPGEAFDSFDYHREEMFEKPFKAAVVKVFAPGATKGYPFSSQEVFELITNWNDDSKVVHRPSTAARRLRKVAELMDRRAS